jgi:hypothetical protein
LPLISESTLIKPLVWMSVLGAVYLVAGLVSLVALPESNSLIASFPNRGVAAYMLLCSLMSAALLAGSILVPAPSPVDTWLNIALLITAFIAGAIVGAVLSPIGPTEQSQFASYTGVVLSAGVAGYIAARLEKFLPKLFVPAMLTPLVVFRMCKRRSKNPSLKRPVGPVAPE